MPDTDVIIDHHLEIPSPHPRCLLCRDLVRVPFYSIYLGGSLTWHMIVDEDCWAELNGLMEHARSMHMTEGMVH